MKKIEKGFLIFALGVFIISFFDFGFKNNLFILTCSALACFYGFGSYFILNLPKKYLLLSVFSGIAFALSFIANIYGFQMLRDGGLIIFFPIPNLILLFGLLIAFAVFLLKSKSFSEFKWLLLRSLTIAIVTSFLMYMPVSSKFYRTVMYGLHNGNKEMQYNLKAHSYIWEFEKYYKKGDCDNAILSAEKGLEFGMKWLERDYDYFNQQIKNFIEDNDFSDKAKQDFRYSISWLLDGEGFYRIKGIMTKLFEAYKCKADNEYKAKNYQKAVSNFQIALLFLDISKNDSNYWKTQKVFVYDDLATSYGKTGEFEIADSLFYLAVSDFSKMEYPNKDEFYTGEIFRNWASLYSDFQDYSISNDLLLQALDFYEKYPDDEDYSKSVYLVRERLILNYLALGDYKQMKFHLDKAFPIFENIKINEKGQDFAYQKLMLFNGTYHYVTESYSESIAILNGNINKLNSEYGESNSLKIVHYLYLSLNYFALSDFENTEKYIEKGLELTQKNTKIEADFLSLYANLNEIKSDYKKAKENYQKSLSIYENLEDESGITLVLFALSEIEITVSDFEKSQQYFNRATKLYQELDYEFNVRNTNIHNSFAHLNYNFENYTVSDSIYNRVLKAEKDSERENSMNSAVAYNGLGLVKFNTKKYSEAEELFKKSIKIYERAF